MFTKAQKHDCAYWPNYESLLDQCHKQQVKISLAFGSMCLFCWEKGSACYFKK